VEVSQSFRRLLRVMQLIQQVVYVLPGLVEKRRVILGAANCVGADSETMHGITSFS
jgi:hypothetical protein